MAKCLFCDECPLSTIATGGGSAYELPTASTTQKGGVIIGTGLSMAGDTLNVTIGGGETYSEATTLTAGLMSATDKAKLDGIAANANNYTLPTASATQKGGIIPGTGLCMIGDTLTATLTDDVIDLLIAALNLASSDTTPGGTGDLVKDAMVGYIPCDATPPADYFREENVVSYVQSNVAIVSSDQGGFYTVADTPLSGNAYTATQGNKATLQLNFNRDQADKYHSTASPDEDNTAYYWATQSPTCTNDCWFFFHDSAVSAAASNNEDVPVLPNVFVTPDGYLVLRLGYTPDGMPINGVLPKTLTLDAAAYANKPHHLAVTTTSDTTRLALDGEFKLTAQGYSGRIFASDIPFYFTEHSAFNRIRWFNAVIWEDNFGVPGSNDFPYYVPD